MVIEKPSIQLVNIFFVPKLKHLLKYFIQNKNDPKKNNQLVNIIKSGLKDLNNEINEMSEEER